MSKYKRLEVLNRIIDAGMVPLYYNSDLEVMKKVIKACYDGGATIFEFTNRGDFAHEVFKELNKWVIKEYPEMILGVGSVVDAGTCSIYIQLGTHFIVSPLLNSDMAKICNRRKVAWIPGCGSVSEIGMAEELGAEIVKVYPANTLGGAKFIKNILAPCPWSQLMPSGGVEAEYDNLKSWFDAGACCVGIGSALFSKEMIKKGDFSALEEKVREVISMIKKIKK